MNTRKEYDNDYDEVYDDGVEAGRAAGIRELLAAIRETGALQEWPPAAKALDAIQAVVDAYENNYPATEAAEDEPLDKRNGDHGGQ